MRPATLIAILLIVLGVVTLAYPSLTYTKEEYVFAVGPMKATVEEKQSIPLPKIAGILAVVGGVGLLAGELMKKPEEKQP